MLQLEREDDFHLPSLPPFELLDSGFAPDPKRFQLPSTHSLDTRYVLPLLAESHGGTAPNPILDSLKSRSLLRSISPHEDEVAGKQQDTSIQEEFEDVVGGDVGSSNSMTGGRGIVPHLVSWESSTTNEEYRSPFYTEATSELWETVAAKLPHSTTLAACPVYSHAILVDSLMTTVLGIESPLFSWDPAREQFDWRRNIKGKGRDGGVQGGRLLGLTIKGTEDLIRPVLDVATLIVRLETVVSQLANPHEKQLPTQVSHALSSALATLLFWMRSEIAKLRPDRASLSSFGLLSLSSSLASTLRTLTSLALLFDRNLEAPPPFAAIPLGAAPLLSLLYSYLEHHLGHSLTPPLFDQAVAAWLFDTSFKGWWRGWEDWVGVGPGGSSWKCSGIEEVLVVRDAPGKHQNLKEGYEDRINYVLHASQLPSFFPADLSHKLFEAGRSLRLLQKAKPEHPICRTRLVKEFDGGLCWKDGQANAYRTCMRNSVSTLRSEIAAWRNSLPSKQIDLLQFSAVKETIATTSLFTPCLPPSIFASIESKILPQSTLDEAPVTKEESAMITSLASLLSTSNPDRQCILPPSTPSLEILLLESHFAPLQTFARLPSTCLLNLFFSDLSLQTHISILHSYLMLGDPSFTRRLRNALFAPPEEKAGYTVRRRRRRDQVAYGDDQGELGKERQTWGVGMGIFVNEKGRWPPGGADLSLLLRTTLDDSIADAKEARVDWGRTLKERERKEAEEKVWEGVEERLSFAFKQRDAQAEEARWSNPESLAALDFLYLDYKPPSPIDLLLTPTILLQYNHIFSHLLRLLRIESVCRSIWTDVFKPNIPTTLTGRSSTSEDLTYLLASDPDARKELQGLAFEAKTLVTSVCAYSFDSAVEGNWKAFSTSLKRMEDKCWKRERRFRSASGGEDEADSTQGNEASLDSPFSLHADFLEKVQRGLLIKKKQAPLLKVIQSGIFGVVLSLGRKVREWRREEGGEDWKIEEVRKEIRSMKTQLRSQAVTLVFVLTALNEKGGSKSKSRAGEVKQTTLPVQGLYDTKNGSESYINELLVRLDINRFYSSQSGHK